MERRQGGQSVVTRPKQRPRRPVKRGLTKAEQATVTRTTLADKARWEYLFSLNKYTPHK